MLLMLVESHNFWSWLAWQHYQSSYWLHMLGSWNSSFKVTEFQNRVAKLWQEEYLWLFISLLIIFNEKYIKSVIILRKTNTLNTNINWGPIDFENSLPKVWNQIKTCVYNKSIKCHRLFIIITWNDCKIILLTCVGLFKVFLLTDYL